MAKWKEEPDLSDLPPSDPEVIYQQTSVCACCLKPVGGTHGFWCHLSGVVEGPKDSFSIFDTDGNYAPLRRVLLLALEQASGGKGAERHGQGKPFDRQPMLEISRMLNGSPIGCMYQAIKKTQEASRMDVDAAQRELLGAINYLAGAYLLLEESSAT